MKERFAALLIGILMMGSVAGFALYYVTPTRQIQISNIYDRALTGKEKIQILRTGRIIIQSHHSKNCCQDFDKMILSFVKRYGDYAVAEFIESNESSFQIIGAGFEIKDISPNVSYDEFFDIFCDMALVQPKECLLKEL